MVVGSSSSAPVQPSHLAPAARRPHGLKGLLCPCFVRTIGDAEVEAVLRQFLRRLLPDPRVRSSHNGYRAHALSSRPQDLPTRLYAPGAESANKVQSFYEPKS